MKIVGY